MALAQVLPKVETASMAACLAQAGQPFVVPHDFVDSLAWAVADDAAAALRKCLLAQGACWHALLSFDGVVGAYCRKSWAVCQADEEKQQHDIEGVDNAGASANHLQWKPLKGQSPELVASSSRPRHIATEDRDLEWVLRLWLRGSEIASPASLANVAPRVYLHGTVREDETAKTLEGTIFEELYDTRSFGTAPFKMSIYASRAGMQTNLHADQHSGFLVQVVGAKRVVLIGRKASRSLRCPNWGNLEAPVNRRSWHDDGVPDCRDWHSKPPFAGLGGCEVEVGPGEALYIPKGVFHDVLSRGQETLGLVLRCSD